MASVADRRADNLSKLRSIFLNGKVNADATKRLLKGLRGNEWARVAGMEQVAAEVGLFILVCRLAYATTVFPRVEKRSMAAP